MTKTYDVPGDEKGYNGWKNYETWCVSLWMDNDEGSYNYVRELAQTERDRWIEEGGREASGSLADMLRDEYEDARPEVEGVWADLLGAALSEVDWYKIADNLLSELPATETVDQ